MKRLLVSLMVSIPLIASSQDMIILRNGDTLNCTINKIDSSSIHYNFQKGDRIITSFAGMNEIRSYRFSVLKNTLASPGDSLQTVSGNPVIVDTSAYVRSSFKWINMITYSQRFGLHAKGWSVQYYGYALKDNKKWVIPCGFGLESFKISTEYFSQFDYQSANINYCLAGISPFRKLFQDKIWLNLGLQLIIGTENLIDFYDNKSSNMIYGINPSQGIFFISESKIGITCGFGFYEKLMNSEVFKNDLGFKIELGIKF